MVELPVVLVLDGLLLRPVSHHANSILEVRKIGELRVLISHLLIVYILKIAGFESKSAKCRQVVAQKESLSKQVTSEQGVPGPAKSLEVSDLQSVKDV